MIYFRVAMIALMFVTLGCEIDESAVNEGKILVDLRDEQNTQILGARVWLDGVQRSEVTPATLTQIAPGNHTVATSKPGFQQASQQVTIVGNETVTVTLTTTAAAFAAVELVDAPAGTELTVGNSYLATLPPNTVGLGVGTWNISAFLNGHATNWPARWTVTLAEGDTAHISPAFTPLEQGRNAGQLAPLFALPGDGDSSIYRLQDYRGKIVLLSFFFYTCVPCLQEFPHIQEIYADPAYAGWLEFFGIDAVDHWSLLNIYKSTHPTLGLQFPLLWDQTQATRTELYLVDSCPSNFLIDPTGVVRYAWLGVTEEELRSAIEQLISEFELTNP
ncbi:MAG: redoxin domain-containing protein [bacterium]|nr:redoxin domain-containing protein [bacterium]